MRTRKVIAVIVVLAIVIVSAIVLTPAPNVQVIGSLPPDDLAQIQKVARKEIRSNVLPRYEWKDVFYPYNVFRYTRTCVSQYEALRMLWVEVKPDKSVSVYFGVSKDTILSEGHIVGLCKQQDWQVTGYGYWGISNAAPQDMHVPSSP